MYIWNKLICFKNFYLIENILSFLSFVEEEKCRVFVIPKVL